MAGHHRAADLPVISIRNRTDQSLHFCHRSVHINGSHRDQGGQVVSIIVVSQTDPIDSNLRGASELGDSATDLHNIAFICRGDGARIVPYFYFDGAGSIRQRGAQKRLAGCGCLGICSFQNIEALHLIRKGHLCDQFVIFHHYSSVVGLRLLAFDTNPKPIDFNILVCGNEQVLPAINDPCLNQVAMLRIDRNCRIGGLNFKAAAINQIGRV